MRYKKLTIADDKRRCELLGIDRESEWSGGVKYFRGLETDTAKLLLGLEYLHPDECQNYSPSSAEIVRFCDKHPGFTMHGYAVSRRRDDCRISLEGIEGRANNLQELLAFISMFRFAEDFDINEDENGNGFDCYCWYD